MDVVPERLRSVMRRLEELDRADRTDGTPRGKRLRAVTPEVEEFLLVIALATRAKEILEIGTSGGYSTLWLAVAARRNGGHVTTFEIDPAKVEIARETFADAGVEDIVHLRAEDAQAGLETLEAAPDLVFLDSEKEQYVVLLPQLISLLQDGGVLVADNLLSHADDLSAFRESALAHPSLSGSVVPVGRGELVAVKLRS